MRRHAGGALVALGVGLGGCGGAEGLGEAAPTELAQIDLGFTNVVRVGALDEAIAVAWQNDTGASSLALYDASLAPLWRVDFGSGQPLRLVVDGGRIHVLAAEALFVFDGAGAMVAQWAVTGAVDFAVADGRVVVLDPGGVVELDDAGAEHARYPVAEGMTSPWALEASSAGYCATGVLDDDTTTVCFDWNGTRSPVQIVHFGARLSAERDFAALTDDGIVSVLAVNPVSGVSINAMRLDDGGFVGEYHPEVEGNLLKLFLGPAQRTMWLETDGWCDENCYDGFRVALMNPGYTKPAWRSQLFEVTGYGGNLWTATVDGERVIVGTGGQVFVLTGASG